MNKNRYDFIIIGAGVVGSMIARWLSRYQVSILLIDKEVDLGMAPQQPTQPLSTRATIPSRALSKRSPTCVPIRCGTNFPRSLTSLLNAPEILSWVLASMNFLPSKNFINRASKTVYLA